VYRCECPSLTCTEGVHLIDQSQVVANDVLILCREYELWFVLGTPPGVAKCDP